MAFIALKCPICGSNVPRQNIKCEYCGAELLISQDGQDMIAQNQNGCPKCGKPIAEGVWFCPNCGEITTKDSQQLEHLRQIQERILFNQQNVKTIMAQLEDKLEPNEFVYYLLYHEGIFSNKYYAVTDKKLIKFDFNQYWQTPYSKIVAVGKPVHNGSEVILKVQTYSETVTLTFGDNMDYDFYRAFEQAFDDYTFQRKDKRAIICNLKIP